MVATDGIQPIAYAHGADTHVRDGEADHDEHTGEANHDEHAGEVDHDEHAEGGYHEGHDHGVFDPLAWQSLRNAAVYLDSITAALAKANPGNAGVFYRKREAYVNELEALDSEISRIVAGLPARSRTVITSHDAFQYFGRDYGLTFLAPQGLSTESEASAQDVVCLVR